MHIAKFMRATRLKLGALKIRRSATFFVLLVGLLNEASAQSAMDNVSVKPSLDTPVQSVQPELSPNDTRQVEYFVLPNNLPVLLISDANADKASAALDVNVGSGEDPLERAGLAHFLEHMLFLGTQKYPDAKEYQAFIQQHGGTHNAFTSLEHTNYFFDIKADQLAGGLDRFAQFFIAPLFNEEYVERERNAVHSEFRAKYSTEYRRQEDVLRQLVLKGHPLSRFRTGNLDSLHNKDGELRKALVDFYQQYYAASNMRLVVSGRQSIAQLKALVTPLFSQIKDFDVLHPPESAQLYPEDFLPASVSIVPNTEVRSVIYRFALPKNTAWMKKPLSYLGFLLGHEGEGSLLWLLQQQGWASRLSAGTSGGWRTGDIFAISMSLTPEGLKNIAQIDTLVFETIDDVLKQGIDQWRFDELKNLGEIDFRFKERSDVMTEVSHLAGKMHTIDSTLLFSVDYRWGEFDEKLIKYLGGYLARENVLRIVTAPEVAAGVQPTAQAAAHAQRKRHTGDELSQTPLYQVPYKVESHYQPATHKVAKALRSQRALPKKNTFVPKSLQLTKHHDALPVQTIQQARFNAWHASNTDFKVPKAIMRIRLKSAWVEQSARHGALAALLADVVRADLNPVTYPAAMAGANFGVSATARGLDFSLSGYSDSLDELLDYTLKRLKLFSKGRAKLTETDAVLTIKNQLERHYRNQLKATPYRQIMGHLAAAIYAPYWPSQQIAEELTTITPEELISFTKALFKQSEVTLLTTGNLEQKQAEKMAKQVKKVLVKGRNFEPKTQAKVVTIQGMQAINIRADHKDNALMVYKQGANNSLLEQAQLSMLAQTLSAPFYYQLRTQQQLGYIVFGSYYPVRQMPGIVFLVQSPETSVAKIKESIDAFLAEYTPDFATQFHVHQLAIVSQLSEEPKNLGQLTSEYWQSINNDDPQFNRKAKLIKTVESLEPEAFAKWYQRFMASEQGLLLYSVNHQRAKKSAVLQGDNGPIHLSSQAPLNESKPVSGKTIQAKKQPSEAFETLNHITDYSAFKAKSTTVTYP